MKWAISIIGSFIFELDAVEQLVYKMELNINLLRSLLALLAAGMVGHSNLPWFQPSNVSRGGGNLVPSFPCPLVGFEKESHSHHGWEFIFLPLSYLGFARQRITRLTLVLWRECTQKIKPVHCLQRNWFSKSP